MTKTLTPEIVRESITKGYFKPHIYLTNLCLSYFQQAKGFVSTRVFPVVPVPLSSARFYEFDKGDLARDNVDSKPAFGHVSPAVFGRFEHYYHCETDQIITGIDQISELDHQRLNSWNPSFDPRRSKIRFIAEQMNIHLDRRWAKKYFNPHSWSHVYSGVSSAPASNQFYCFDNDNSDPVSFFNSLSNKMLVSGLRRPNKMVLGVNVFAALQNNPSILERIKYQGSESNPAHVTENVLAQLFKLDEVIVAEAVFNAAPYGAPDDLNFICDPNSVLLTYTTNAPSIEEPSAGYTFTWDILGNGQLTAVQQYHGTESTHSEFIEGLICTDPQITAPDLGVFLNNAVSPDFTV